MSSNGSFGMMEGAFFVSRSELLQWVNDLLQVNINKVEQMASGAAYCQIVDSIFPGTVALSKVNWNAKFEHEFIQNYKVLQQAFDKNMINKHIEVEKLIKAKYQDNLEFLQWFKRFFDLNHNGAEYNALEKRKGAKTPWDAIDRKPASQTRRTTRARARPSQPRPRAAREPDSDLSKQIAELRMTSDTLEKERDFYFGKLRAIELFCEHYEDQEHPAVKEIQKILYATDDETVTVNEDGSVTIVPVPEDS